jgi:hypothetical protein
MRFAIWILACLTLAAGLTAAVVVPAGKAAVAEMVIGKVDLVGADGGSTALSKDQALDFGDRIVCGSDGRVLLQLASRASARMAPNSEMSFQDPAKRNGTFLNLVKGWARFLVGQRDPGEAFEVSTDNAVAAVKGTDLEVGVEDNGSTFACVYSSEHHPALSFGPPGGTNNIDLNPGQGATFDGANFNQFHDLGPAGQPNGDRYKGLPTPGPTGDQGDNNPNPNPSPNATPPPQDGHNNLDNAIQGAVNQLGQDLQASNNQDNQDRNNDLASGRVGVDRFGYQVRMSNNLIRTAPDTVVLSTLSERTAGPNQGVTSASVSTQYNQVLPEDWIDVIKLSLTDPANLNRGLPIWWQIQSVFTAANPVGDSLVLTTLFSNPYLNANAALTQDYVQDLWAYSFRTGLPSLRNAAALAQFQVSEELYYDVYSANSATGNFATDTAALQNPVVGGSPTSQGYYGTTVSPLDGGVTINNYASFFINANNATTYYPVFTQTFHILDGAGNLQPIPSQITASFGTFSAGGFGSLDFLGVDRSLNIETSLNVPTFFKQPIDLLIMPEIYDGMGGVLPIPIQPVCYNCGG